MRFFFLLLIGIIACFSCSGQKKPPIADYENYFRKLVSQGYYQVNGSVCQRADLHAKVPAIIKQKQDDPLPTGSIVNYQPYYSTDAKFRNVIDRIDKMPINREQYFSSQCDSLKWEIKSFKNLGERAFALTHFVYHFLIDDSLISADLLLIGYDEKLIKSLSVHTHRLPIEELAESFEAQGDLLRRLSSLKESLVLYLNASFLYDSVKNYYRLGLIENKIADLYLGKPYVINREKAIEHYEKASDYFGNIDDSVDALTAEVKICSLLVYMPESKANFASTLEIYSENILNASLLGTSISTTKIDKAVDAQRLDDKITTDYRILRTAFQASSFENYADFNGEFDYCYNTLLGLYFSKKNDIPTAIKYYETALFAAAMTNYPNYNRTNYVSALSHLSWIYSYTSTPLEGVKIIDDAILYSGRLKHRLTEVWLYVMKANHFSDMNRPIEGLVYLKKADSLASIYNNSSFTAEQQRTFYEYLYGTYKRTHASIGNKDSVNYYDGLVNSIKANTLEDLSELSTIEGEYLEELHRDRILKFEKQLEQLVLNIQGLNLEKIRLAREFDSLLDNKTFLEMSIADRNNQIAKQNKEIAEKENRQRILDKIYSQTLGKKQSTIAGLLLSLAFLILASMLAFLIVNRKNRLRLNAEKDLRMAEKEKLIAETKRITAIRDLLSAESKNKVHSLQNSYTKFLFITRTEDYSIAKGYAKKCAKFFRTVLNKWDWADEKWSLSDELEMMYQFLDTENIPFKEIKIVKDFGDIDTTKVKFESEVFTTLLSNSIKYAFKGMTSGLTFSISAILKNGLLYFEIKDNGKPSEQDKYILDDGKVNGLKILKQKIELIAELNAIGLPEVFSIYAVENSGTTIKFILPYAEIKNINSRK